MIQKAWQETQGQNLEELQKTLQAEEYAPASPAGP